MRLRSRHWGGGLLAVLATLILTSCRVVEETVRLPGRAVGMGSSRSPRSDVAALQAALQRFADEYFTRTIAALDEYARRIGTPNARSQVLAWKVPITSATVGIASGPNPAANLLDLITLAAVTHLMVQELAAQAEHPAAFQPWLEVSASLEREAWELATGVFQAGQQQELQSAIYRWWAASPDARNAFFGRPQELGSLIHKAEERSGRPASVFSIVGLDPTAGLDPAVREVTRARLFAERALFTAQRMPFLLRWQVEFLSDQLLRHSQVELALTNAAHIAESAERLSHAAETVSLLAAQLPDRLSAERAEILSALETQEGKLRELLAEVGQTLTAGEKLSGSLNTTLLTFDALMKRFGVGEPDQNTGHPEAPPFHILDYAHTAERLTVTAQELTVLLREAGTTLDSPALDRRVRDLEAVARQAKSDARSLLNHAFLLLAGLVVLTFGCALLYRRWGRTERLPGTALEHGP